jgi:hypothetical protein
MIIGRHGACRWNVRPLNDRIALPVRQKTSGSLAENFFDDNGREIAVQTAL